MTQFDTVEFDRAATIERDGFTLSAMLRPDDCSGSPWDNEDGHGPVTDWTTRAKRPSERVLIGERRGHNRYYDFAEACRIALRDGWGAAPYSLEIERGKYGLCRANGHWFDDRRNLVAIVSDWHDDVNAAIAQMYAKHRATMTPHEYAARAAESDFQRLRGWCDDSWSYVGVVVTASREGVKLATASLWGIESDAGEYLVETANDLAAEAIDDALATLGALCAATH